MTQTILLVARDFEFRVMTSAALVAEGFEVNTVSSYTAALSNLLKTLPDLILVDLEDQRERGLDHVRAFSELTQSPIIVLSETEDLSTALAALDIADDYLTKGTPFELVMAKIRVALRRQRAALQDGPGSAMLDSPPEVPPPPPSSPSGRSKPVVARLSRGYRYRPREYSVAPGTSVLVADTASDDRERTTRILKRQGMTVIEADTGMQALFTIAKYRPWLVVSELALGSLDGMTLIRTIKSHPKLESIKVIIVSSKGDPSSIDESKALGANDYIVKPCSSDELVLRVKWLSAA